jgi:outer membrane protein assembly factor BamB
MTRFKTLLTLTLLCPLLQFAQVEVKWDKQLPADIHWQEVTALGNLIVSSQKGLMGIDTETGEVAWNNPQYGGLYREAYEELPNSPFFTVTSANAIQLVDQFSGNVVFNSAGAGLKEIASYFLLYNSDAILVAGKDNSGEPLMVSVKMSDGSVSWSMNEKFGRIIAANELKNGELLLVTLFNNYKLNTGTGDIIWKEANSKEAAQAESMGALGALLKQAAENMVQDTDIELRFYRPEGSDVFYLGSQQEKQSMMTSSSGNTTVNYINSFNAYNISDGSLVWEDALEMDGALGQVAFLKNGLLVLPDDGNRTKINLFDYKTQQGLWGKKGRGIAIKGGVYDYLDSGNGILLVSRTANKDYLNYLDPVAGAITFEKPVKVDGTVVGIVPMGNGILYITTESMNILDPQTGTLRWDKSVRTAPQLTAERDGKVYALDNKTGLIRVVEMSTGEISDLTREELKFEGNESPRRLEVMEDGLFVYSDQNVAKFGFDGSFRFQQYFAAPREPGWKRALLYAEAVRAAYIGAASYYVSGAMAAAADDVRREDALTGEVVAQVGAAYGELGDVASSYAGTAFRQASARLKATTEGRDFMFIMSKKDKDIVLLKVSKHSGAVDGEISLGKDREPIYAVDDVTGQVYYCNGNTGLTSYQVR